MDAAASSTLPRSSDYISMERRFLTRPAAGRFVDVPDWLAPDALGALDEVALWSAPWRPSPQARFSFLLRGGGQLLRVEYDSPGGPLEVRADGATVVYILQRPGPVSEETATLLAKAMFGALPPPGQSQPLAFMPPDAEGVRFYVRAGSIPDERLYTFKDHDIGLYGGLLTGHRVEFVSLYWNGAGYGKGTDPPRWSAHPDYLRVWVGEGRDPRDGAPPPMPER